MLLLLFHAQPAPPSPAYINASTLIGDLWPPLNATSAADAVFWTDDDMIRWFNEAGRRLSGNCGAFVVRNESLTAADGVSDYALPDAHQATLQAELDGAVLRPRTVRELEALDSRWMTRTGTPKAFILDSEGLKQITLYPQPDAGSGSKTIALTMRELPGEVTLAAGLLTAPPILQDYFSFSILAEARSEESHAPMLEVAQWLRSITSMYEQAIQGFLGGV